MDTYDTQMKDKVLNSIQEYGGFSNQDLLFFTERIKYKKLAKNEVVLQKGDICRSFYFVISGALRQYHISSGIDEVTRDLYAENDWVVNHKSFTSQKPSESIIVAFDASQVFELDLFSIHELIGLSPAFFQLGKLLELSLSATSYYDHHQTPEEKYSYILMNRPILIQRFPLKYIASYLKITPETLSRVRKKLSNS